MKKYTFLNSSIFRGGNVIPMYRVFDTDSGEVYYEATSFAKTARGKSVSQSRFAHPHRSEVAKWRQSVGQR